MPGTKVTAEDVDTGESESIVIVDDWNLVCDGAAYVSGIVQHGNGTVVITIKKHRS